ncbi:hypothetical protein POKO110462_14900 [Pontibacter korlensis]|uniref:hypothetical protein n=1 Tax=Pontibacter korlensis TaxID=400092 RepID=UPI000697CE9D|nr:hypothetical protein [Pontibacter korlensis]
MRRVALLLTLVSLLFSLDGNGQKVHTDIIICSRAGSDVSKMLEANNYSYRLIAKQVDAVKAARKGGGVIFIADGYPEKRFAFEQGVGRLIARKKLRVFVEYPASSTGLPVSQDTLKTQLERAVIATSKIKGVDSLGLFAIHNAYVLGASAPNPLVVVAKVAGFDNAQYGIGDVKPQPLLFQHGRFLVATTRLSNAITSRFGPVNHIRPVWEHIFRYLSPGLDWRLDNWPLQVKPMHAKGEILSSNDYRNAIRRGADWFYKGRFLVHPEWEALFLKRQGDGTSVAGPPLDLSLPSGDGSLGVLEGHLSRIQADGSQIYRYWMRADCNAEVAYALSVLSDSSAEQARVAGNLLDYVFKSSNLRAGNRNDPGAATYGLVGWSTTHPHVYYGDDNARVILGALGASARLGESAWDKYIAEAIIANFRTTGKNGFRGERLEDAFIMSAGLDAIRQNDLVYPHPHFEAWMWACYLWLYDKTGYRPFLEQTKKAISITMDRYPNWKWTNGIQQERARMILPLAWLVRVEDTPQHRKWLSLIADRLLENMDESGAIREELGAAGDGMFGATKSNADYGKHEAPLIAVNGDPVADMLYTTNFAFFALNEAAAATGDAKYQHAVEKLADFLVRIQVESDVHPDLDGAWFRAFDYNRWEYWASNADAGWGAWGTLTGWTQSWIVSTLALQQEGQSLWEISEGSAIGTEAQKAIDSMLGSPRQSVVGELRK